MSASAASVNVRGAQDSHVTSDPDTSFWKASYARHSPFAMEPKFSEPSGQVDWGRTIIFDHDRIADAIQQVYLVYTISALNPGVFNPNILFTEDVGRAAIVEANLDIGQGEIDSLTGEFMSIWEELSLSSENHLLEATGKSNNVASQLVAFAERPQLLYVPLPFYHTKHPCQALPVVALHLTRIKYSVTLRTKVLVVNTSYPGGVSVIPAADGALSNLRLLTNNIYMHQRERHWFTRVSHKYLTEQVQLLRLSVAAGALTAKFQLDLNHPIKELLIVGRTDANTAANNWLTFTGQEGPNAHDQFPSELFTSMELTINGNSRVSALDPIFYRIVQSSQHHSKIPRRKIYVWSYAIDPESIQPTGSLNHSRIDRATFNFVFANTLSTAFEIQVYGRNLNIAHVERGSFLHRYNS